MSRVEELASIAQEIARSFDDRVNGLEALRQMVNEESSAARERLRATAVARQEMSMALRERMTVQRQARQVQSQQARETLARHRLDTSAMQRSFLAEGAARRQADVAAEMMQARLARQDMSASTRDQLQKEHAARKASIAGLMGDTRQARLDMRAAQSESLGEDRQRRVEEVKAFQQDVQAFLAELRDDLQVSSQALQARLSSERADQRANVRDMLVEMHSAREAMAEEQARELAHHRAELQAEVSESIAGFQTARANLRSDLGEFGQRWKEFASVMRGKRASRGSQGVEAQSVRPEPTPSQELETRPPVEEGAESPLHSLFVPPRGPGQLAEEVFLSVRANPEGVELADLESQYNLSRIEMAQVLKHLIETNRVRKEEKLYFEA